MASLGKRLSPDSIGDKSKRKYTPAKGTKITLDLDDRNP